MNKKQPSYSLGEQILFGTGRIFGSETISIFSPPNFGAVPVKTSYTTSILEKNSRTYVSGAVRKRTLHASYPTTESP